MSEKAVDLFKAIFILVISIIIIGALIQDSFGISDAAKKIFLGIGGIGAIVLIYRSFISKTLIGR